MTAPVLPPRDIDALPKPRATRDRVVSWVINRSLAIAKRQMDVKGLQEKLGATRERVFQLRVVDIGRAWKFRLKDGNLDIVPPDLRAVGGLDIDSETLIAIAVGKRTMMEPGTGKTFDVPFSPMDALTHGDLKMWGEAVSNDALLFARAVYHEVAPILQAGMSAQPPPDAK